MLELALNFLRNTGFALADYRHVIMLLAGSTFVYLGAAKRFEPLLLIPIGLGIITAMAGLLEKKCGKKTDPARFRFATGMMLMAAYASSTGGIGTPVGTPPNLIGLAMIEKFAGVKIPFFRWMLFAVPMLVAMYILLFLILYGLHRPEMPVIFFSLAFAPIFVLIGPNDDFAIEWAPILGILTTDAPRWISWAPAKSTKG